MVKDLAPEMVEELTVELAASGAVSLDYVQDLSFAIRNPKIPLFVIPQSLGVNVAAVYQFRKMKTKNAVAEGYVSPPTTCSKKSAWIGMS